MINDAANQSAPPPSRPEVGRLKTSAVAVWSLVLGMLGIITCLPALPALILGIIGVVTIRPEAGLKGKGFAVAGVVLGALGILLVPIIAAIALPGIMKVTEAAKESLSISKVRQLSLMQVQYAADRGAFAKDWDTLFEFLDQQEDQAKLVTSPLGDGTQSYILLLEAGRDSMLVNTPLILDPNRIERGYVVGFGDGSVRVIGEEEARLEGISLDRIKRRLKSE